MANLPFFKDDNQNFQIMQNRWKSILDPIIGIPILNGNFLQDVNLTAGSSNMVNHQLGRMAQGWIITDINFPRTIYRAQPFNQNNITLACTGSTTISLWVF